MWVHSTGSWAERCHGNHFSPSPGPNKICVHYFFPVFHLSVSHFDSFEKTLLNSLAEDLLYCCEKRLWGEHSLWLLITAEHLTEEHQSFRSPLESLHLHKHVLQAFCFIWNQYFEALSFIVNLILILEKYKT